MWRYLNMFILIGVALIGISILGFANAKFLAEPGQAPSQTAPLIYLGAGVLMLINGAISIRFTPPPTKKLGKEGRSESDRSPDNQEKVMGL